MKNQMTIDRIANSIIQRRKKYENFILVEGSQDRLFLLKFKNDTTQVEITFGWEKLLDIIAALKKRGFAKAIGLIDKDLRDIIPEEIICEDNVIITEEHDLNIMCIEKSFDIIFENYCSQEKVEQFKIIRDTACLKTYTYDLAKPLSFLKILNKREKLNLSFKSNESKKNKLDYTKFIDKNKYEIISFDKLVETVTNFSRNKTDEKILKNEVIVEMLKSIIAKENFEQPKLNSGHDFGEIITLGLRKALGTTEIDSDTFLKEAILTYDSSEFSKTSLFKHIKALEVRQSTVYLKSSLPPTAILN